MTDFATVITKARRTRIVFDYAHSTMCRPPVYETRTGPEIARGEHSAPGGVNNVMLLPSGAWCLKPYQAQYAIEQEAFQNSVIAATDFSLANALVEKDVYRMDPATGISLGAGVAQSGDPFMLKRITAGQTWENELASDVLSFSKPSLPRENVAVDRVAASKTTYPANSGFAFRFQTPGGLMSGPDTLARFYWGGPADTTRLKRHTALPEAAASPSPKGGQFALSLLGSGVARLHELLSDGWRAISDFRWSEPGRVSGRHHMLMVVPRGGRRMDVLTAQTDKPQPPGPMIEWKPRAAPRPPDPGNVTITTAPPVVNYRRKRTMTGPGPVRVDVRRDLRLPWQVSVLTYPTTGHLYDLPISLNYRVKAGTHLFMRIHGDIPAGTSINALLYDAETHSPLTLVEPGEFEAPSDLRAVYAYLELVGNGSVTPYLRAYEVWLNGLRFEREPEEFSASPREVSITGPDKDPTTETAHVIIQDPTDALAKLRVRGRFPVKITTQYDPLDSSKTSVLFEGETLRAAAKRQTASRGEGFEGAGPARAYPSPNWRRYDIQMVGKWAQLQRQVSFLRTQAFGEDRTAAIDPKTGAYPPWKVTDIIRACFHFAGIPDDQVDIPDLPMRLWANGENISDLQLQPLTNFADYILTLTSQYLGYWLVWDGNAGSRGKWRIRPPATPPYTNLASFVFKPAASGTPRLQTHPNTYSATQTFIESDTFESFTRPPEANYILVTATGQLPLPGQGGALRYVQSLINPVSFDFDPENPTSDPDDPDYLGEFVPLVVVDSTLAADDPEHAQAAVNFVCRRLYDQVAHAQKWVRFRAPLILIGDAGDSELGTKKRMLRYYDPVTIDGNQALIQSATPDYRSDQAQMAWYEALIIA